MAAETAGHLDIVPGSKVADTHALAAFGEGDDVPVSFHVAMLGVVERRRLAVLQHDQSDLYESVSECGIVARAIVSEPLGGPFQKFI